MSSSSKLNQNLSFIRHKIRIYIHIPSENFHSSAYIKKPIYVDYKRHLSALVLYFLKIIKKEVCLIWLTKLKMYMNIIELKLLP